MWDPMILGPDKLGTHTGDHGQPNPYTDRYTDLGPENPFSWGPDQFGAR